MHRSRVLQDHYVRDLFLCSIYFQQDGKDKYKEEITLAVEYQLVVSSENKCIHQPSALLRQPKEAARIETTEKISTLKRL